MNRACLWMLAGFVTLSGGAWANPAAEFPELPSPSYRVHADAKGRVFAPLAHPVYLLLSTSPKGDAAAVFQSKPTKLPETPVLLKAGANVLKNHAVGVQEFVVHADGTPPRTKPVFRNTAVYRRANRWFIGQGAVFALEGTDTASGLGQTWAALAGQPFQLADTLQLDLRQDRRFRMQYYSVDQVGNPESPRIVDFEVDVTPPQTVLRFEGPHHESSVASKGVLVLEAEDAGAGVKELLYQLDNGTLKRYQRPLRADSMASGKHTLQFYSRDRVNNTEARHTTTFYHDTTPPDLQIVAEAGVFKYDGVVYISDQTRIRLDTRDAAAGVESVSFRVDEGKVGPYQQPFLAPPNSGLHWIHGDTVDRVGNRRHHRLKLYTDGTPPTTDFRIEGPLYWSGNTVIINRDSQVILTATDLESRVKTLWVCLDDKDCVPYQVPITIAETGPHRLQFYAEDHVGNREATRSLAIVVDNSPWATSMVSKVGGKARKRWVLSEDHGLMGAAGLEFFLRISADEAGEQDSYLLAIPPAEQGPQPLVFARNKPGTLKLSLSRMAKHFRVNIDGDAPVTKPRLSSARHYTRGGVTYFGEGAALTLIAQEPQLGFQSGVDQLLYSLNDSGFVHYTAPIDLFFLERQYQVRYYAVDRVGNAEPTKTLQFEVDLTPPRTNHEVQQPFFGNTLSPKSRISLASADGLSGVKEVRYQFGEENPRRYQRALTGSVLQALPEGVHEFRYFATDRVGNRELPHTLEFTLDKTPPAVALSVFGKQHKSPEGKFFVAKSTRFRLAAQELRTEVDEIRYRIGEGAWQQYRKPFGLPEKAGRHRVSYDATDKVGNRSKRQDSTVFLDLTPPETSHRLEGKQYRYEGTLFLNSQTRIYLHSADPGSGVGQVFYRFGTSTVQPYSTPITQPTTGAHVLRYFAVDQVGNGETPTHVEFFVDSTPPELSIQGIPPEVRQGNRRILRSGSHVQLEVRDAHSGVQEVAYSINGKPFRLYRRAIQAVPQDGVVTLEVYADDWVNNHAERRVQFVVE